MSLKTSGPPIRSDLEVIARDEWDGCARVIFDPDQLVKSGFSRVAVEACTEIIESNLSDPKQTIFDNDGNPVNQMRGVVLYDLAVHIARQHELVLEYAWGLQTTLRRIQAASRERLGLVTSQEA
jgi:hypothetical protein